MRKLLSVISSTLQGGVRGGLLFVALLATTTLWAEDFSVDGIYYNYLEGNNVEVTYRGDYYYSYENEYSGEVIIPSTVTYNGTTYSIKSIGYAAFYDCSSLTSITIPNSVTSIGDWAFFSCPSLTSVTIGNSVTSIGYAAFYDCSSLTSITIPNSVTSIGDWAFSGCSSLTSVTIGNNVTSIGDLAFYDCSSLTSITIPNSVTTVGGGMFYGCSKLKSVVLSNNITSLPSYRDSNYDYDYGFFGDCPSLTSVTIPNSVTSIGNSAFASCSSLTSIVVESGNTTYDSRDNCNAIIETATNTLIAGCQNTIIPNSVTSIGDWAFYGCSSLTSINIPNSVTSIGYAAFAYCSSLTSVTIPNSVTSIGNYAFEYCSSLTSITIPNSVRSIGEAAFSRCSSLTSITIPNSVTSIGEAAFSRCSSLTSITIPNSVTSIGGFAFYGCSSLSSVTIPNSVTSIGLNAFAYCSSLTKTNYTGDIADWCNIEFVDSYANPMCYSHNFYINDQEIKDLVIPNTVDSIHNYAFCSCSSLTSINIPNSVTSIGNSAFASCSSLTSIVVESGNTIYDSRDNCNAIIETATNTLIAGCQNTVIPYRVTSIGFSAFSGCSSLTSITIPESVTSIEDAAFYNCSSLDTIYVKAMTPPSLGNRALTNAPASICYIPCGTLSTYETSDWAQYMGEFVEEECDKCGNYLYWQYDDTQLTITGYGDMYDYDIESHPWMQYRSKMQTISLPDGLTSVGAAAFADCKYVKSVTIPATVEKIHDSAFEDCRMLSSLNFTEPSALTFIGNWAFYNCHQLQNLTIPEGVTEIGDAAFYGCTYLEDMVLPSTIQAIGDNGFALCAKLQKIHVKAATPPTIQAKTFFDVNRQIPVYVPATAVEAYEDNPYWQEFNIQCNSSTPTAVEDVAAYGNGIQKLLRDGKLLILKDNKVYTLMGTEL